MSPSGRAAPRLLNALLLLAALLSFSAPVQAQSEAEGCTDIADDQLRLACYDTAFGRGADTPAGDPIDAASGITLLSEQLIPARPTGRDRARIDIACVEGDTEFTFSFAGQLMSEGNAGGSISLRIDQQPTQTLLLPPSEDLQSLRFSRSADAVRFLRQMLDAENLFVRTTPPRQRTISVNFSLRGFDETAAPFREACDW